MDLAHDQDYEKKSIYNMSLLHSCDDPSMLKKLPCRNQNL